MELTGALSAIFTLIVLEVILSADNALILGVLVQRLPVHLRRKALFYGILGALVFRALFIAAGSVLMQYHIVVIVFGAFLILKYARPGLASLERGDGLETSHAY